MNRINTIIVHGSLGSGKTTLVVSLLKHPSFQSSFVIENEFANENIDKHAISDHQHETLVYDIAGGCICCSSGKELAEALDMLVQKGWQNPLIIETTGVAQSAQLVKQLYLNPTFVQHYNLIKNIYVLDPLEVSASDLALDHFFDVALADVIVIGKADLLPSLNVLDEYKRLITGINPQVLVLTVSLGKHTVADFKFSDGSKTEELLMSNIADIPTVAAEQHGMQYTIERLPSPVSKSRLTALQEYVKQHPQLGIKRIKGYVVDTETQWWHVEITAHHAAITPSKERVEAVVVAIGVALPEDFIRNALY